MLLQGLGQDALRLLESSLKDIWRILVRLQKVERDEALLAHIGLALDEVDGIVKKFFQPDASPVKNIYVLDAPPDQF